MDIYVFFFEFPGVIDQTGTKGKNRQQHHLNIDQTLKIMITLINKLFK